MHVEVCAASRSLGFIEVPFPTRLAQKSRRAARVPRACAFDARTLRTTPRRPIPASAATCALFLSSARAQRRDAVRGDVRCCGRSSRAARGRRRRPVVVCAAGPARAARRAARRRGHQRAGGQGGAADVAPLRRQAARADDLAAAGVGGGQRGHRADGRRHFDFAGRCVAARGARRRRRVRGRGVRLRAAVSFFMRAPLPSPPLSSVAIVTGVATWQEYKSDASVRSSPRARARARSVALAPRAPPPRAHPPRAHPPCSSPRCLRWRRPARACGATGAWSTSRRARWCRATSYVRRPRLRAAPLRRRGRPPLTHSSLFSPFPPSLQRCAPATACPPTRACSRRWTLRRTSPR